MKLITRKTPPWTAKTPLPFAWTCKNIPKWSKLTITVVILEHYDQRKDKVPIFLENLRVPGSKQYSLLVDVQCLDDLLYQQLSVQSVPANTRIVYKWITRVISRPGFDSDITTKKCRGESGTYLIAASSVLLSSVKESVGSRRKKENHSQTKVSETPHLAT